MSKTYVMLDLETFSTKNNALIVSIGAVKFTNQKILENQDFYRVMTNIHNPELFHINFETVKWWLKQSEGAREALWNVEVKPETTDVTVLYEFNDYIKGTAGVFGNGATFDNVILRNALNSYGITPSWSFKNDKCYRTIKQLFPTEELERLGTHHHPLDDARTQANHLIKLYQKYNFVL